MNFVRLTAAIAFFVGALFLESDLASARSQQSSDVVYGTAWGITLSDDGTGFYNDVLYAVLANTKDAKPYRPQPYRRAKMEFVERGGSCLFPARISHLANGGDIDDADAYIESKPLIFVESHLFSVPGGEPLESLAAVAGKKIAYPNGSALPTLLAPFDARFIPTTNETTKANMLLAGRVDYMSGSLPDNIFVFRALGRVLPPYNPALPLAKVGVGIVCHKTTENSAFIDRFDDALIKMFSSGVLEGLFGDAGVDVRFMPAFD